MESARWARLVSTLGRLLLSVHFGSELVDKLTRFSYWVGVVASSTHWPAPVPLLSMVLVVLLLLFGTPCLLVGRWVPAGCAALLIFQIPTSLLFESSLYERLGALA